MSVPAKMRGRRAWVRADGKRPIQPSGVAASSTDTRTWHTWDAVQHGAGDGFGVMLGDGLACYDLDRVSDSDARRFISTLAEPIVLVERSISGKGVHVFLEAPESKGWKRVIDGLSVEFYSRARFIRMTGVPFKV